MPWAHVGGVSPEEMVAALDRAFGTVAEQRDLAPEIEPGIRVWSWSLERGTVRVESLFGEPGDGFEVEVEGGLLGRLEDDWTELDFGTWLVDRCAGAVVLVDDPQHCSTGGSDFVRVTGSRIERVWFVDDPETGVERIDESLTELIAVR